MGYDTRLRGADGRYFRSVVPTNRELQVLGHTLELGRKPAAAMLGVSERTVTHTLTQVYNRLGVENRCTAAIALGWLRIPAEWSSGEEPVPLHPAPSPLADQLADAVVRYVDSLVGIPHGMDARHG